MGKRLAIVILMVGLSSAGNVAVADCAGPGAGQRNSASVKATLVEGVGTETVTVTIVADNVEGCADGSSAATPLLGARTELRVIGADASCKATTTSDWDPFGFGAGIHGDVANNHDCSADISWGGFTGVYAPDVDASGPTDDGTDAYLGKDATVENGVVWLNGAKYGATGIGRMRTGAGIDS